MFRIPPGATFPYKEQHFLQNLYFSKEETSGMEPLLEAKTILNILLADISYPLDKMILEHLLEQIHTPLTFLITSLNRSLVVVL
jgi:hypothetical protein